MAGDDSKGLRSERVVMWLRCAPPDDDAASAHRGWLDRSLARVRAGGGRTLAALGSTVVASFDSVELIDTIELALALTEEDRSEHLHVSAGIAVGEVLEQHEPEGLCTYRGDALDHAELFASKARGGEVVLDDAAVAPASEHFLFAREIATASMQGRAIDTDNPRKDACRMALSRLKPAPTPKSVLPAFEALRQRIHAHGLSRIVVRSESAVAPLELIERLALAAPPSLLLRVGRTAGGLQPLGGLALAVRRVWPSDHDLEGAGLPAALRARLKALLRGQAVARSEMVLALTELLTHCAQHSARPWLVLDQLHEIDPATLGVIAEVGLSSEIDAALIMTLLPDVAVPPALVAKSELHEITLPSLDLADRRAIAEAVLSLEAESEIALRIALLGGETAGGIVEAARTLVSAGDLVARGEGFSWRTGPRSGTASVPVEALITERAMGLCADAYRALEVLCVAPADAPREVFEAVAAADGLSGAELEAGLRQLIDEGFIDGRLALGAAEATVRAALRNNMPPARAAELHRFAAEVLRARLKAAGFGSGQLAYHLAEGGLEAEAALALINAAKSAVGASFHRVGLRLLATAVELDGSAELRALASAVASDIDAANGGAERRSSRPPGSAGEAHAGTPASDASSVADNMAHSAMQAARGALVDGDFEAVEHWLDAAVAAGFQQAAAQRLLAISLLARGRAQDATAALARSHADAATGRGLPQDALCWALVHLESGQPHRAVRDALSALAHCRRTGERRGERVALQVLSWCYEGADYPSEAARIASFTGIAAGT